MIYHLLQSDLGYNSNLKYKIYICEDNINDDDDDDYDSGYNSNLK